MQLDAERVAETREWLTKAALDLRAADFELTAQPPLTADIVFHSQQSAEKSLKAFLPGTRLVGGEMVARLDSWGRLTWM